MAKTKGRIAVLLFILAFTSLTSALTEEITRARAEWESFKSTYGKKYTSTTEDSRRMTIFTQNKDRIVKNNQEATKRGFKLALNKFGDLTQAEYLMLNGYRRPSKGPGLRNESESLHRIVEAETYKSPPGAQIPDSIDWTKKGAVTPVKDQGQCGSCWSFSATGALEGQHFLHSHKLVSLSEQNLVDCSLAYGNDGCNGGWMDAAFQYIWDNHGIDTERSYPYQAALHRCRYREDDKGAVDHGFVDIRPEGDEEKLKEAVALVGPIAVAIDASHESFQFYSYGVYNEPACSTQILDHAVLVVGYGTERDGTRYWLIKNSWGTDWGDHGYMKMSRNRMNQCGIATAASYPKV